MPTEYKTNLGEPNTEPLTLERPVRNAPSPGVRSHPMTDELQPYQRTIIDSLLRELRSEQSYILPYHRKKPMIDWSLMHRDWVREAWMNPPQPWRRYVFVDEITSEPSASAAPEASPSPSSSPEQSAP